MTFIHRVSGRYLLFPLFGLLLGIVSGCSDTDKGDPATNIAAIGSEHLTQADFNAYLRIKRIPENNKNRVERAKKTFLERNALAQVIAKQPAIDSTELNAELREFRNELLTSRYFETFLEKAVDNKAVKKYYEDHQTDYQSKELNLAQILFRVRPQMTEQQSAEIFKKAVKVHQDLKKGSNFTSAVKKHSDDYGSKRRGGRIGWIKEGQIDPVLFAQAAKLKKGQMSQPVRAHLGYYIVKMLDDPKVTQRSFESIKGQISYQLRNEAKRKEMARLMSQIKVTELK